MNKCVAYTSIARALRDVFIQPPHFPKSTPGIAQFAPTIILQQNRTLSNYRKAVRDEHPVNDQIQSNFVDIIRENGIMQRGQNLQALLKTMNLEEEVIQQTDVNKNGRPICKIFSKKALWEQKLKAKRKAAASKGDNLKQMELSWQIDENDLGHRLKKLTDFLQEGKRVEMILAPKRGGRKATDDEMMAVLKSIRNEVSAIPGARESKAMEGVMGAQCTMTFTGRETPAIIDDNGDKLAKKTKEKQERKEKEEKRLEKKKQQEQSRNQAAAMTV